MAIFPATIDEVTNLIKSIKNNTNLNDILPSSYIKSSHDLLIDPITSAINNCFDTPVGVKKTPGLFLFMSVAIHSYLATTDQSIFCTTFLNCLNYPYTTEYMSLLANLN